MMGATPVTAGLLAILALALPVSGPAGAQQLKSVAGDTLPPALELEDLDGRAHALSDYRDQVVLVNFWTTWCPPCVKEIPVLQRLERRMAGRPFNLETAVDRFVEDLCD